MPNLRYWRCWLRLYHRWSEPTITGTHIVQVCLRCGKRVERVR